MFLHSWNVTKLYMALDYKLQPFENVRLEITFSLATQVGVFVPVMSQRW